MTPTCVSCEQGVSHCHGTLIVDILTLDCTDPDCQDLDVARHTLVLDATEIDEPSSSSVSTAA
ncbi:hypothetical protein [Actinokineospora iranica]|uniref:Uncharacterized protein n=1 Tax=Actinokineospora iranica TaxID=1271860 RepID=A0A1G6K6B2_9PSEU|nr:hypothetical protein [Actinokineospora iranica]SDC26579.1 hypothetical protein SAMN05216174_101742 [Actinokineospora iranica]